MTLPKAARPSPLSRSETGSRGEPFFGNLRLLASRLASDRGELLRWVPAALCVLAIAYRFYGRFIAARVLCLDASRPTPAHTHFDGQNFTLQGTFSGLATPATQAHLCMSNVMGGTGPVIHELTVTAAPKGEVSGRVTLTPEQVVALKRGRIYLLLDSQKAPKGNLWGWFQPAHKRAQANVPQQGSWYIPNILLDDTATEKKKPQG